MLLWVWVAIAGICAAIAWHCMGEVKKANAQLRAMQEMRELWEWGTETRIAVRDKLSHEFVSDIRVLDLFVLFKTGQAYENAKMLWQNEEFKVFAAGPRPKGE